MPDHAVDTFDLQLFRAKPSKPHEDKSGSTKATEGDLLAKLRAPNRWHGDGLSDADLDGAADEIERLRAIAYAATDAIDRAEERTDVLNDATDFGSTMLRLQKVIRNA